VRLAIFVDGCFWHCCPEHGRQPKVNTACWTAKLRRNVQRDGTQSAALSEAGWLVMRFWAHEPLSTVVDQVVNALAARRDA
jgi:DNA mismatch endonuclease (patch repair protein)